MAVATYLELYVCERDIPTLFFLFARARELLALAVDFYVKGTR